MKRKLIPRKRIPKGEDGLNTNNLTWEDKLYAINHSAYINNDGTLRYTYDKDYLYDTNPDAIFTKEYPLEKSVNNTYDSFIKDNPYKVIAAIDNSELPAQYLNLSPYEKLNLIKKFRRFKDYTPNSKEWRYVDGVYMFAPESLYEDEPFISKSQEDTYLSYPDRLNYALNYLINSNDWGNQEASVDPYWTNYNIGNKTYLQTWRPFIDGSGYIIGHSELRTPYGIITKELDDKDYDIAYNNCSDSTRRGVLAIEGEALYSGLFTTPGNVRDFALLHGWIPYKGTKILRKILSPLEDARLREYIWKSKKEGKDDF